MLRHIPNLRVTQTQHREDFVTFHENKMSYQKLEFLDNNADFYTHFQF